ncbi:MAG: PQQ-binding-like beta-propeller repeat protein [Saprospiraceae bacterium]|nr:PQQ-binding-like beta-propeller repeat protein [Saprospiraceae bacterium]
MRTLSQSVIFLLFVLGTSSCCSDGILAILGSGVEYEDHETPPCEPSWEMKEVKWVVDLEVLNFNYLAETNKHLIGVSSSSTDRKVLALEKETGEKQWEVSTNFSVSVHNLDFRTFDGSYLIFSKYQAMLIESQSGEILDEISFPFNVKDVSYRDENFYLVSDPCDSSTPFGIYRPDGSERKKLEKFVSLSDWSTHTFFLMGLLTLDHPTQGSILLVNGEYTTPEGSHSEIRCYSIPDGKLKWSDTTLGNGLGFRNKDSMLPYKEKVLITRRDRLSLIDPINGSEVWGFQPPGNSYLFPEIYVRGEHLFLNSISKELFTCLDPKTGNRRWIYTSKYSRIPPAVKGSRVIWGDPENPSGTAKLHLSDGKVIESLEVAWDTCMYEYSVFLTTPGDIWSNDLYFTLSGKLAAMGLE